MVQQTAINELLVWVRKTLPMDLDYLRMIEDKIESLIPKEKEQISQAYVQGLIDGMNQQLKEYYNETYGENKQE